MTVVRKAVRRVELMDLMMVVWTAASKADPKAAQKVERRVQSKAVSLVVRTAAWKAASLVEKMVGTMAVLKD